MFEVGQNEGGAGELDDCQIMEPQCCCHPERLSGPLNGDYAVGVQDLFGKAAYLYVGAWSEEHESMEAQADLCPARRVFDWLFLRGTETRFRAPVLSERLTADLLHCFAVRPDDLPVPAADPGELSSFLTTHLGFAVLPEESAPAA